MKYIIVSNSAIDNKIKVWTHERHPGACPDMQGMECLFWEFWRKLTIFPGMHLPNATWLSFMWYNVERVVKTVYRDEFCPIINEEKCWCVSKLAFWK